MLEPVHYRTNIDALGCLLVINLFIGTGSFCFYYVLPLLSSLFLYYQVATPPSTLTRCHTKQAAQTNKSNSGEDSFSFSESEEGKNKEAELCGSFSDPVSEEMQRMLNQL